jgi:hypothetical protein
MDSYFKPQVQAEDFIKSHSCCMALYSKKDFKMLDVYIKLYRIETHYIDIDLNLYKETIYENLEKISSRPHYFVV